MRLGVGRSRGVLPSLPSEGSNPSTSTFPSPSIRDALDRPPRVQIVGGLSILILHSLWFVENFIDDSLKLGTGFTNTKFPSSFRETPGLLFLTKLFCLFAGRLWACIWRVSRHHMVPHLARVAP